MGKKIITSLAVFLLVLTNIAQGQTYSETEYLDSLHTELEQSTLLDTVRVRLLYNIGDLTPILRVAYWDSIVQLSDQVRETDTAAAVQLVMLKFSSSSLNNIGYILNQKGDSKGALENYGRALAISEQIGNDEAVALAYNNIGAIKMRQGNTPECLEYYQKSLAIYERTGNPLGMARGYNNIARIHSDQNDDSLGLVYFQKAIDTAQVYGLTDLLCYAYMNIGTIYHEQEPGADTAIAYFNRGLELAEQEGNVPVISHALNHLGAAYHGRGDTVQALAYLKRGLPIWEKLAQPKGLLNCLTSMAKIEFENGQITRALLQAERAYNIALDAGYVHEIARAAEVVYEIASAQGDWEKALAMRNQQILMEDSLDNQEAIRAAAQQHFKTQFERSQAIKDREHEQQMAIEQADKARQRLITYFIGGGLLLVVGALVLVFKSLRVTRKQKNIIEGQKEQVEFARAELEEKNLSIMDSINYAKRIQTALLPPQKEIDQLLPDSFVFYEPKDVVAGDFYWMAPYASAHDSEAGVLFAVADCTGHGVPGALVSVVCNNGLNRSVREFGLTEPGKILEKTREIVIAEFEKSEEEVKDGMDIALCSIQYAPDNAGTAVIHYAGAHNPLWVIRKGAEDVHQIKASKQPIGKFDDQAGFETHQLELQKGDIIYLFSDGFADQFGGHKGKKFKTRALRQLLLSVRHLPMAEQNKKLNYAFHAWKDDYEQVDDVCVMGVRV